MTPAANMAEVETDSQTVEDIAERLLITAMAVNPLVALDRTQLLAAAGRVGVRALLEPKVVGRVVADLGRELAHIARGESTLAPEPGDRRFGNPAWSESPLFDRLMQGYLAWRAGIFRLVDDVELDSKSRERGRFVLSLVTDARAVLHVMLPGART